MPKYIPGNPTIIVGITDPVLVDEFVPTIAVIFCASSNVFTFEVCQVKQTLFCFAMLPIQVSSRPLNFVPFG